MVDRQVGLEPMNRERVCGERKTSRRKEMKERGISQMNNPPTLCPFNSQHRQREMQEETGTQLMQQKEQ